MEKALHWSAFCVPYAGCSIHKPETGQEFSSSSSISCSINRSYTRCSSSSLSRVVSSSSPFYVTDFRITRPKSSAAASSVSSSTVGKKAI